MGAEADSADACGMAITASVLDADDLARARELLEAPVRTQRLWPALVAAAALALAALAFATAMLAEPPLTSEHPAQARSVD